ncbi:hypothetical protein V498_01144 [Pseudogymnoascus sp. VKM F-4517 (FW-2822)]|nr:hypothetical protein V498_01144 [Pseudogymnoascus sp. VKM F-4517 (FW-2822)]
MKRHTSLGMLTEQTPLLSADEDEIPHVSSEDSTPTDTPTPNQPLGPGRAILIILSICILIFLQGKWHPRSHAGTQGLTHGTASNMSGITTAQSTIADDLDASGEDAIWFTSAYLISMASLAPLVGRLSQIFSTRSCILSSAFLFVAGGLLTGHARSFNTFIAGRIVSGSGGAGVMTLTLILVIELAGTKRRGLFLGLTNAGFTTGVALGAVVAGGLVGITGWRPLFWGQAPLAALAGMGIFWGIPTRFGMAATLGAKTRSLAYKFAHVDYSGAALLTTSLVLVLLGLTSPKIQYLPILISPVVLALFIANELYLARDPIIPIPVLRSRGVLLTCLAQVGLMSVRWSILFYAPVYALAVRNWSPATAGSILIPTNAGFALGGLLVGGIHIRRAGSFYLPTIMAFTLFTFAVALLAFLATPSSPASLIVATTALLGLSTGAAITYTLAHLLHLTAPPTHFVATSLITTFRGFAGSFGTAIGGGLFVRVLRRSLEQGFAEIGVRRPELIDELLRSPATVGGLKGLEAEVARAGYVEALRTVWFSAAAVAGTVIFVQAAAGWKGAAEIVQDGGEDEV